MVVIVLGVFILDEATSARREEWLKGHTANVILSRSEPGCIEFTLGSDPVDTSRVLLVEIWENVDALEAHLSHLPGPGDMPAPGDRSVGSVGSNGIVSFDSIRFEVAHIRDVPLPQGFAPRSDRPGWWNGELTPS